MAAFYRDTVDRGRFAALEREYENRLEREHNSGDVVTSSEECPDLGNCERKSCRGCWRTKRSSDC